MEYIKTEIEGVLILKPRVFKDERGYFMETFRLNEFREHVGSIEFVQENESESSRGVVRGLHFQRAPFEQAKLVRCVQGRVIDVAVDIRPGSPTYGKHVAVELSEENKLQLFLPHGMAHGFSALSNKVKINYKCDNYYSPESEGGYHPLSPEIGIDWQLPEADMIISAKDKERANFVKK